MTQPCNPQTGHEFSVVGGLTYNTIDQGLQYRSVINSHIDWAASQFINPHVHIGVAGYVFQQLTGDSVAGATLGPFKGRAIGIGPQRSGLRHHLVGARVQGSRNVDTERQTA